MKAGGGPPPLSPAQAYRLWAPTYGTETVVSALENRIVRGLELRIEGMSLLDVGCGTGRRLDQAATTKIAVGVDLVPEMLRAGRGDHVAHQLVAANVSGLPFAPETFEVVWCRLVLGHVRDLVGAYREIARVSRSGAEFVVSDFHSAAVAAGHTRSFRDAEGRLVEIEHHVHDLAAHEEAAKAVGWRLQQAIEAAAGDQERRFYERAGRLRQFESEVSLPLVLVMRFTR